MSLADDYLLEVRRAAKDHTRVMIGGARGQSRKLTVYVLTLGRSDGAARRLYEALFEHLPPPVFDELQDLFTNKKDPTHA